MPIHFISALERSDSLSYLLHNTSHIQAQDGGQRVLGMRRLIGANFDVQRIYTAGANPDKNLATLRNRVRHHGLNKFPVGFFDSVNSHHRALS